MANMVDYLVWRGEIPMEMSPWNAVDGLLMATLSYLNMHGIGDRRGWTLREAKRLDLVEESPDASFPPRKAAFDGMADSARFGDCRMHHFIAMTDEASNMQFSAMCVDLPDGTMAVAFRGTDNTLVGWREDFDMSYRTWTPGQEAAGYYLAQAASSTDRPLRLVGHSKGGNLAVYAAALSSKRVQDRIESIWSYDGPGMNRETSQSEGYLRIKEKIHSYIPQTSIIGLLMDYFEPYTVVRSNAGGISQHEPMTWQIYGPRFETLESVDQTAVVVRDTLHEWLQNSTPEQRADFVDALFGMVETTKATRVSDLTGEKLKSLLTILGSRREVDPETRKAFTRLMAQAVTLGFGNVIDWVRGRRDEDGGGQWETMSPEKRREMLITAMNRREQTEMAAEAEPSELPDGGETESKKPENDP